MIATPAPRTWTSHLMETIPDAVISVGTTGTIDYWNQGAMQFLGSTAEQAVGQTLALIISPEARPPHIHGFHRAMEFGRLNSHGTPALVTASTADGATCDVAMSLAVRSGPDGTPVGAVAVMRPAGPREPLIAYAPAED